MSALHDALLSQYRQACAELGDVDTLLALNRRRGDELSERRNQLQAELVAMHDRAARLPKPAPDAFVPADAFPKAPPPPSSTDTDS